MSLDLGKIGDPTEESPKDFPDIYDSNIDKLEAAFTSNDTTIQGITADIANNTVLIEYNSSEIQVLSGAIDDNTTLISGVSSLLDGLSGEVTAIAGDLDNVEVQVSDLETLTTGLQDDLDDLSTQFQGLSGCCNSIVDLQDDLIDLETTVNGLGDGDFTDVNIISGGNLTIGDITFTDTISAGSPTPTSDYMKVVVNGSTRWIQLFS